MATAISWCIIGLQIVTSTSREPPGNQICTVLSQGLTFPAAHMALQTQAGLGDVTLARKSLQTAGSFHLRQWHCA